MKISRLVGLAGSGVDQKADGLWPYFERLVIFNAVLGVGPIKRVGDRRSRGRLKDDAAFIGCRINLMLDLQLRHPTNRRSPSNVPVGSLTQK